MMRRTHWRWAALSAIGIAVVSTSLALAASAKKYQVTGNVVSADEKMIVVQKGDEKWELDRTADTKVDGRIAVGEKVMINYHMVADHVDARNDKGK